VTRGGPPASELGKELTISHCKTRPCYEMLNRASDHLAQDSDQRWAFVNMVMNLQVLYRVKNFLTR